MFALLSVMRVTTSGAEQTAVTITCAPTYARSSVRLIVPESGIDLVAVERALIQFALDSRGGNRTRAAAFLGLTRSALIYRMQKYGLASAGRVGPLPRAPFCGTPQ
jgi:DNA-binding NtrC family response regulator